jgi:hypothetical protein
MVDFARSLVCLILFRTAVRELGNPFLIQQTLDPRVREDDEGISFMVYLKHFG